MLALGIAAGLRGSSGPAPGPVGAAIITPNTTVAPRTFPVYGSYRNLPAGTLIWASTFDPRSGRYFPQDKPCVTEVDGTFDCGQHYLGAQDRPDTSSYRIDVLVADAAASNQLLQYQIDKGGPDGPNSGLAALPPGATTIYSRSFVRS